MRHVKAKEIFSSSYSSGRTHHFLQTNETAGVKETMGGKAGRDMSTFPFKHPIVWSSRQAFQQIRILVKECTPGGSGTLNLPFTAQWH